MRNNFTKKAVVIITIYFFLLLLRKTILSFDIRILHWLLNDIKFPNQEGHVKGFLNLGKIKYNLTHMRLSGVAIEHSNIDTSTLWGGSRYLNITLQNGNANFYANWAYSTWPSLAGSGRLTLDINNASLQFGVDISSNQRGFINFTSTECTVKITRVNLEFYHKPGNMLFDSIKPSLKKKAEENLPKGLCEALRRGFLERITSSIQNVQHKFVHFILSGDVNNYQSINALGWILVYIFIIAVKVIHDYGVTLLVMLGILALYLIYELLKFIIVTFCSTLSKHRKIKVRSRSDPEPPPEQEKTVLNPVSVTVKEAAGQQRNGFLAKFKKLLWWRKPKEN